MKHVLLLSMLSCILLLILIVPFVQSISGNNELNAEIYVNTLIPGSKSYRGCNASITLVVYNGLAYSVNVSVKPDLRPLKIIWSNYTETILEPRSKTKFTWIIAVPRNIDFGNYTLGFNITYMSNSTVYSIYKETWIEVIPRNITLITADLYRNITKFFLVISNPLQNPGQYVIENISVTLEAFNVTVEPRKVFIDELWVNSSYTIPLIIGFDESDIGFILVNITTYDDVHGLVYFNYTFIVVNATAYLDLYVINDYGKPLPGAVITIANRTYTTDLNGHISLTLPIGIYNYTAEYNGHKVSGKIVLLTGYSRYTVVIDLMPPIIDFIGQRDYGILVSAHDPGNNCSGIHTIIFIQNDRNWTYQFFPRRNLSVMLYPMLKAGTVEVIVKDLQGNAVNTTLRYVELKHSSVFTEVILVASIALLILVSLLILTRTYG